MFNKNSSARNQLDFDRDICCPICRNGNISAMPMMQEAFACDSCNHIFTIDLDRQVLKSIDLQIPIFWRWHGKYWQAIEHRKKIESIYSGLFC